MNCKFYSEEICKCLFDGPPDDCTFENNEDNCTCFKPIKENNNGSKNMKKCKFYLRSPNCIDNRCLNPHCKLKKCWFTDQQNECENFEPHEEGVITAQLITDKDNIIDSKTLIIQNCDKIILKPKSLEVEVKIEKDNFDDFDFIEINGHKFKRV